MRVYVHVCCAPCLTGAFEILRQKNPEKLEGFFYNPNIHPQDEYRKRLESVKKFSSVYGFEISCPEYNPSEYFTVVSGYEDKISRCQRCWSLRLEETARCARKNEFTHFTTTLLISPYQEHDTIVKISKQIAEKFGLEFLYIDFRSCFRGGNIKARQHGFYMQKYCGCSYSVAETGF